jgi:hypothetical protein
MKAAKFQDPKSGENPVTNHKIKDATRRAANFHFWNLKFGASLALGFWCLMLSPATSASAQSYSIDWCKISGGGGTSTSGVYSVSGAIGQPDAGGPMIGGDYSLTGGFWALISVAQTPGLPHLIVTHLGNSVIISWPDIGSYTLQQDSNPANSSGWMISGYSITTVDGTNSVTITQPAGNLFFRLKQ